MRLLLLILIFHVLVLNFQLRQLLFFSSYSFSFSFHSLLFTLSSVPPTSSSSLSFFFSALIHTVVGSGPQQTGLTAHSELSVCALNVVSLRQCIFSQNTDVEHGKVL
jgi:hypothetical protein